MNKMPPSKYARATPHTQQHPHKLTPAPLLRACSAALPPRSWIWLLECLIWSPPSPPPPRNELLSPFSPPPLIRTSSTLAYLPRPPRDPRRHPRPTHTQALQVEGREADHEIRQCVRRGTRLHARLEHTITTATPGLTPCTSDYSARAPLPRLACRAHLAACLWRTCRPL